MTLNFSQRYGYSDVREIFQTEGIDGKLKNGIWNALLTTCFDGSYNILSYYAINNQWLIDLCSALWSDYFKNRIHELPKTWDLFEQELEHYFYHVAEWFNIYDLIEFISNSVQFDPLQEYQIELNKSLEKEMSGFRLISNKVTPIIDEVEIKSIEDAISNKDLKHVSSHFKTALAMMSNRETPDYRNSIKESISAVEGVAKLITGERKLELKGALNKLDQELVAPLHGGLKAGFLSIYGYTSDGDGIRHALTDEESVSFEDAKFMIVACSAFVNYLVSKAELAGIEIK